MTINAAWVKAALIRAIRTFAQAAIAALPTTAFTLGSIDWLIVVSTAAGAAILSLLMSVANLPEADAEENRELAEAYLELMAELDEDTPDSDA